MSAQEAFYTRLTALAALCSGFTLTPDLIDIYDRGLADLGYELAGSAIEQVILGRSSRDPFPSVKEIRAAACPEERPEDAAALIVARIYGAIASIGPYNAASARRTIGDTGWEIVQAEGGWSTLCESVTYDNAPTHKAQWRRLAEAMVRRKEIRARTTELEHRSSDAVLKLPKLNSLLERIGDKPPEPPEAA